MVAHMALTQSSQASALRMPVTVESLLSKTPFFQQRNPKPPAPSPLPMKAPPFAYPFFPFPAQAHFIDTGNTPEQLRLAQSYASFSRSRPVCPSCLARTTKIDRLLC